MDGIDYLTGETRPLNELRFVVKDEHVPEDSDIFVFEGVPFAEYVGHFVDIHGVAKSALLPAVVSVESLETIRRHYEAGTKL